MTLHRRSAIFFVALLLAAAIPASLAQGLLDPTCSVEPGMSIQTALDRAPTGASVVVCPGIYSEKLVIARPVTLTGRPGAILDGSVLTGTRVAITLAQAVSDVTIEGLEIRNYQQLTTTNDTSAAITSAGNVDRVLIRNNNIHDNGWAGVVFGVGRQRDWTITNNTFEDHRLAHILAEDAGEIKIDANRFTAGPYGIVLAAPKTAIIGGNTIEGDGRAAIMVAPSINESGWAQRVTIHHHRRSPSAAQPHGLGARIRGEREYRPARKCDHADPGIPEHARGLREPEHPRLDGSHHLDHERDWQRERDEPLERAEHGHIYCAL